LGGKGEPSGLVTKPTFQPINSIKQQIWGAFAVAFTAAKSSLQQDLTLPKE
jgi:hypothetical protein